MKLSGLFTRIKPIFLKLAGRQPLCPWNIIVSQLDPRTVGVRPPPMTIELLRENNGLKLLRFNGIHEAWFPVGTAVNMALWNEYLSVFWDHPQNAHYYQSKGSVVAKGDICLDCGTCEGFFTMQALELGAAKVVCIEPSPLMMECLRETFATQILQGRVIIKQAALSSLNGSARFGSSTAFPAYGKIGAGENSSAVELITLESLVEELGLPRVDYIKMDIEGAEMHAVEGALPVIKKDRPKLAITTYHRQFDFACLRAMLIDVGYSGLHAKGFSTGDHDDYRPSMLHASQIPA